MAKHLYHAEINMQLSYLTNKEALTVLCSVVKHTASGYRARKKCRGKHKNSRQVFLSTLGGLAASLVPLQQKRTTE